MTSLEVGLKLLAVLLLVGANAFFVAAEFALVSVQDTRLAQLIAKGDRLARAVRSAQKDLNLYLSSCQVGITLASLGLGWIGEPAIARSLVSLFAGLPEPLALISRHVVAGTIAFILITYLHVVLGEVAPSTSLPTCFCGSSAFACRLRRREYIARKRSSCSFAAAVSWAKSSGTSRR